MTDQQFKHMLRTWHEDHKPGEQLDTSNFSERQWKLLEELLAEVFADFDLGQLLDEQGEVQ